MNQAPENNTAKIADIILTSIGFASGMLLLSNLPMLFVEYGRFIDFPFLLAYIIIAAVFLLIGKLVRTRYHIQAKPGSYFIIGIILFIISYISIAYLSYYIEMSRYV